MVPTEADGSLNVHRVHRLRLPHPTTTVWDAGCPHSSVMLGPGKALRPYGLTLPRTATVPWLASSANLSPACEEFQERVTSPRRALPASVKIPSGSLGERIPHSIVLNTG